VVAREPEGAAEQLGDPALEGQPAAEDLLAGHYGEAPAATLDAAPPGQVVGLSATAGVRGVPVELHALALRAPSEVQPRDEEVGLVEDLDLWLEGREPGVDGPQPGPALHVRLGAGVGEPDQLSTLHHAAVAGERLELRLDLLALEPGVPEHGVERGEGVGAGQQPGDVGGRADQPGDADSGQDDDVVLGQRAGAPRDPVPTGGRRPRRTHQVDGRDHQVSAHREDVDPPEPGGRT